MKQLQKVEVKKTKIIVSIEQDIDIRNSCTNEFKELILVGILSGASSNSLKYLTKDHIDTKTIKVYQSRFSELLYNFKASLNLNLTVKTQIFK